MMVFDNILLVILAHGSTIAGAIAILSPEMTALASSTLPTTITPTSSLEKQPYVTWIGAANQDVVCPEQVGSEPWYCWDHWCREEDVTNPGHCYKINPMGYHCECKPMPRPDGDNASMTTITTAGTLWGQPTNVTLTYALETIATFTALRKYKITTIYNPYPTTSTTTTTAMGTATGNDTGLVEAVETAGAVIAAGGTMWVLLEGWIGPAEAIMAELGPGDMEEGDDPACPADYDHNCVDPECMGEIEGMCTVGEHINCPCVQCPDKEDLFCDVEECSGFDGQCTKPGWAECACSYRTCPGDIEGGDGPPKCEDADKCGGAAGEGPVLSWTCKGLEQSDTGQRLYQDCICEPYDGPEPLLHGASESDINKTIANFKSLPEFTEDSWPLDTTLNVTNSSCSLISPAVLRVGRWEPDGGNGTGLDTFYRSFCEENHGKLIGQALVDGRLSSLALIDDISNNRTPVWFSIRPWDDRKASHKCDAVQGFDDFTLNSAECISAFEFAASKCDPDNAYTKGGSMPGYCLVYEILPQETYHELNPPWANQYTEDKLPQCGDEHKPRGGEDGIGLKRDFWGCMSTKFCNDPANFDGQYHKYSTNDYEWETGCNLWNNHEKPDNITTTPYYPWPNSYGNDYTFFYLARNLTDAGCDKFRCQNAFNHIMFSSCGVTSPTYDEMVPSGSINEMFGCGKFDYTIEPPETFDVSCTLNETDYPNTPEFLAPSEFNMTEVTQLIQDFCYRDGDNMYIPHPLPPGREDPTYPQMTRQVGGVKGPFVRLEQVFAVDRVGGAIDPGISTVCLHPDPINNTYFGGARCVKIFTDVINKCSGDDDSAEIPGAWAFEHEDLNGCVVYTISAFYWHKRGGKFVDGLWQRALSWPRISKATG